MNSVHIATAPALGKAAAEALVQSIVSYRSPEGAKGKERAANSADDLPTWAIKNRYYEADVGFTSNGIGEGGVRAPQDVVIVLLERAKTPSSSLLREALEKHLLTADELEVALLVSYGPHSEDELDEDAWDDAAIQNGFEWVDLGAAGEAALAQEIGRELGEMRTGLARIVEALESHLWPEMTRLSPPSHPKRPVSPPAADDDQDENDNFAGLGPMLPDAGPFVPMKVEFPDRFLPSLPRTAKPTPASRSRPTAGGVAFPTLPTEIEWAVPPRADPKDAWGTSRTKEVEFPANLRAQSTEEAFGDDFTDFVSAGAVDLEFQPVESLPGLPPLKTTFDSDADSVDAGLGAANENKFFSSLAGEQRGNSQLPPLGYRPLEASFPDSDTTPAAAGSTEGGLFSSVMGPTDDDADDDITEMFQRLARVRQEVQGKDLDERRRVAEEALGDVLARLG